jgi:hypothetical protein
VSVAVHCWPSVRHLHNILRTSIRIPPRTSRLDIISVYIMTQFLSSFLSQGSSSSPNNQTMAETGVYALRPSLQDSSVTLVHPSGQSVDALPLYSVHTSKDRGLQFYRGIPRSANAIGNAQVHKWNSSSAEISLNGQSIHMEISS